MSPHTELPASLFIYFRLNAADASRAQATLQAMQQGLRVAHPGLLARLFARTDALDRGDLTWMETYEHPQGLNDAFMSDLAKAVSNLPTGLIGPRHTEVFAEFRVPPGSAV